MKPSEAVLLNVVAAVTDTGNSAGFGMSMDLDSDHKRTLLCYTKIDEYSNSSQCFTDRVKSDLENFELEPRDVFCVRNRSQAESEGGLSLKDASTLELKFFANPEGVALVAREQLQIGLGRANLAQRLADIQRERIAETLPLLMPAISTRLSKFQQQLDTLPVMHLTEVACIVELQQQLSSVCLELKDSREGRVKAMHNTVSLNFEVDSNLECVTKETNGRWEATAQWHTMAQSHVNDDVWESEVYLRMKNAGLSKYCEDVLVEVPDWDDAASLSASSCPFIYPEDDRAETLRILKALSRSESFLRVKVYDKMEDSCFSYSVQSTRRCDSLTQSKGDLESGSAAKFYYQTPCTVDVQVVVRIGERGVVATSCSSFARLKDNFIDAVRSNKPLAFFFSDAFFRSMKDAHEQYRGHEGLPGTFPSHIAVDVARQLQQDIYPLARKFADDVNKCAIAWTEEKVSKHLNSFPSLHKKAVAELRRVFSSAHHSLGKDIDTTLRCFNQVMLEDHYFSFVVKDIQGKIGVARTGGKPLGFITKGVLQVMSNHDQGILGDIVRLAAYWKAMCKEFSGHVSKLVKLHLFNQDIEEEIRKTIFKECAEGSTLLQLMSPTEHQKMSRKALEERIENLKAAKRECEDVLARGLL
mmetsp:Transcript_19428/g.34635  ORF Transcript_19428/g.34635 Transcript_19428/m.34635 type:complete len:642 (-) Transcript_19428:227-2152(-)